LACIRVNEVSAVKGVGPEVVALLLLFLQPAKARTAITVINVKTAFLFMIERYLLLTYF
jgi:hypothetical protein